MVPFATLNRIWSASRSATETGTSDCASISTAENARAPSAFGAKLIGDRLVGPFSIREMSV